ncbi:leucine-rich repeat-containing protein 20-like [Mizuhopecten yessoensis]|uniref:Leucine-rich repeat-containing protein 20 n=1 Tax=Mizuhopecten yessoensis TaxID=6573 RepID=A0A210QTP9_MIZYE|nr:leucine-rich repeat-containing protein 20-like [Mizuhopecten yessoensis]OWF52092.1 Leucine-rich repeat-containing protein 20 [Mizuhopecten yessoensis]
MATEVQRKAASEVAEISRRLQTAKENGALDLSGCGLMKVPDAVYMVLRGTTIQTCNLSQNQLQKVPPKLPVNLNQLQELNLSKNSISELPEKMAGMSELKVLDLSMNRLSVVPPVVYQCGNLLVLKMSRNAISEIDVDKLVKMQSLQEVDLCGNPLSPVGKNSLLETRFNVLFDDIESEESMSVD